jgi:protein TonB
VGPAHPVRATEALPAPPEIVIEGIPAPSVDGPTITDATLFGDPSAHRGRAGGQSGPDASSDGAFFQSEVEKPAIALRNNPVPRYPEILRAAGVEGTVLVQFIVDTAGHAELQSLQVLHSTHELFVRSVRASLPGMGFLPAETGGRKVRMWVRMPFEFAMAK